MNSRIHMIVILNSPKINICLAPFEAPNINGYKKTQMKTHDNKWYQNDSKVNYNIS